VISGYRELYFDQPPASIAGFHPHTLIISGLSKSHAMTGWRLGWVYGDPEIVQHLIVFHQYATTCASTVSQQAALAAFTDEGPAATADLRTRLRANRDFMIACLDRELGDIMGSDRRITPEGAFFLMLEVSRFGSSLEVAERLLQHRVITMPGSAFGEEAEGYLRLSFATEERMIQEGIQRLKEGFIAMSFRE